MSRISAKDKDGGARRSFGVQMRESDLAALDGIATSDLRTRADTITFLVRAEVARREAAKAVHIVSDAKPASDKENERD